MQKLWFKAKRYGWGWHPASWQGWLVLAAWVLLLAVGEVIFINRVYQGDRGAIWWFVPYVLCLIATLTLVAYKTGEPPHWHWGDKD
jgi:hypothetical protein